MRSFFCPTLSVYFQKSIEGLQLKSLSEFASIEEARTHIERHERMISSDVMRVLMFNAGLYDWFMSQTEGLAKVAADNVRSGGEFNFMPSHALYLGPLLDGMIATQTAQSEQLTALKAACLSYAVKEDRPYEHVSEYEFKLVKGEDIPLKPVHIEGGKAFITTSGNCEPHNPQIFKVVRNHKFRVGSFYGVKEAKEYAAVISEGGELFVHDSYGVI